MGQDDILRRVVNPPERRLTIGGQVNNRPAEQHSRNQSWADEGVGRGPGGPPHKSSQAAKIFRSSSTTLKLTYYETDMRPTTSPALLLKWVVSSAANLTTPDYCPGLP
jgi:hypothetical protein